MLFERGVLIYNPVSGGNSGGARLEAVLEVLRAQVGDVRLAPTQSPFHAADLAREATRDGCDLAVVFGGDGTVNEAVQGLAGADRPALLVLPGGTANVLIREMQLPLDPAAAAASLPSLQIQTVRLGLVEHAEGEKRFFLLMCGAGVDADIAARTPSPLKRRLGMGAFWLQGAGQVLRPLPRLRVTPELEAERGRPCGFVVVSKSSRYGGGLQITPGANLLDDRFEVARFSGHNRAAFVGYLLAVVCRATAHWPGIRRDYADDVRLTAEGSDRAQFQVDGEVAGDLPIRVSVSPITLSLLMPPRYGQAAEGIAGRADLAAAGPRHEPRLQAAQSRPAGMQAACVPRLW